MSAAARGPVRLVFSVDVEEEGLFSGRYAATAQGVSNVAALERLEFLTREYGLPLTLLCTWPVLNDPGCGALLRRWQDTLGAELGAHLHPWSTPPLAEAGTTAWTPSEAMDGAELDAKLGTLVRTCQAVSGRAPVSFRMGRFDLGPKIRGLLPRHGLRVDSSLVPTRWSAALPEAFLSPTDPHALLRDADGRVQVLEAPLTLVPMLPALRGMAWRAADLLPETAGRLLLRKFQAFAAAGTQPVWYPQASMRLGARLHLSRGGRVIHMFLHSTELSPGFCPHLPDAASIERLLARIRAFLDWLQRFAEPLGGLRPTTLAGLLDHLPEVCA